MENLMNKEVSFTKSKTKINLRYLFLVFAIYSGWTIYEELFIKTKENISIIFLLFHVAYFVASLLLINDTFQKNYISLHNGFFKVTINFYTRFSFHIEELNYVDRHFDDWSIRLKNGKIHQFSDQIIRPEEKAMFKDVMNCLPKKHPEIGL